MKTEHVDFPKKGDTMFNGDLMVEVTHVEPLENGDYTFDFCVVVAEVFCVSHGLADDC